MNNPATIFRSQNHAMHNSSSQISHFCSVEIKRKTSWDISIVNIVVIFLIVTRTLSNLSLEFAPHQQVLWFVPSNIAFQYPIWPAGGCQRCHEICNSDFKVALSTSTSTSTREVQPVDDRRRYQPIFARLTLALSIGAMLRLSKALFAQVQKCKKQGWLRQQLFLHN